MEAKDYDLSNKMSTYLCNFATNGDPNGENCHEWIETKISKKVLWLGESEAKMGKPSVLKMIGTMLTNKAVGE